MSAANPSDPLTHSDLAPIVPSCPAFSAQELVQWVLFPPGQVPGRVPFCNLDDCEIGIGLILAPPTWVNDEWLYPLRRLDHCWQPLDLLWFSEDRLYICENLCPLDRCLTRCDFSGTDRCWIQSHLDRLRNHDPHPIRPPTIPPPKLTPPRPPSSVLRPF